MSLHKKTITAALWNLSQRVAASSLEFIVTLTLAHYLSPADFGLLAMMALFIAVANSLMESGFTEAIIRKPDAGQLVYATAFFSNLVLGLLSYGLLFIFAPFIESFYQENGLTDLIRVTGLVVLVNATKIVHVAILSQRLDFKNQLKATIPAAAVSGIVAIILGYVGLGVWALVAQMLVASVVSSGFLWLSGIWRPEYMFSVPEFRAMYDFGLKMFLANLNNLVFRNMYLVVIARIFSATVAGHYYLADKIKNMLLQLLVGTVQAVTYPALASIQNEEEKLKSGYRQIVKLTTFMLFPLLLFVAAFANPFFHLFLPENWLPGVPYLQLLCFSGLLYPLHAINLNMLKVKGRSGLILYLDIIKKLLIIVVLILSYGYGVKGIIMGQIVCSVLAYLPNSYYSSRLFNYSIKEQFEDFYPSLILASVISGVGYLVVELTTLAAELKLFVVGGVAVVSYIGVAYILGMSSLKIGMQTIGLRRAAG